GVQPSIAGITLSSVFLTGMGLALLAALFLHFREPFVTPPPARREAGRGGAAGVLREISHAPLGIAAAIVVAVIVASMAAAFRNQYPAYSAELQNLRALGGESCGIADKVLTEPDTNAGLLESAGDPREQLEAGTDDGVVEFRPDESSSDLTATESALTDTMETGEDSDPTTTTAGTGGGVRTGEGINGSHAVLPFGLDPSRVPVLGSHQDGIQLNASTTTDWYELPADVQDNPLITIAVAGSF